MSLKKFTYKHLFLFLYCLLLFFTSFIFQSPGEILENFPKILFSPSNLITDYFRLAGLGTTFFSVSLSTFITLLLIILFDKELDGDTVAAVFTMSGFSFFGKNIFNSFSISLGSCLYAKFMGKEKKDILLVAIYATCLAPLVSEIAFDFAKGTSFSPISILVSQVTGILIGFISVPLASEFKSFHRGFSLYNIGFVGGIIGMILTGFFRMFNYRIDPVSVLYKLDDMPVRIFFLGLISLMFISGLIFGKCNFSKLKDLMKESGQGGGDFTVFSFSTCLINMALVGLVGYLYVVLVGGKLEGPVLGGLLTMVGFGASGKHVKNIIPVIAGIFVAMKMNIFAIYSTPSVIVCLFGTALAPISTVYGPIAGFIAGFAHTSLVTNIGNVHGGVNLYNNGFSSGFIAATLVPIFELFKEKLKKYKL